MDDFLCKKDLISERFYGINQLKYGIKDTIKDIISVHEKSTGSIYGEICENLRYIIP